MDLILVHVIDESRMRDWAESMDRQAPAETRIEDVTRRLEDLAASVCSEVKCGALVLIGRPYQMLEGVVKSKGAGMVVLGAHDVSRRRLGAVAARCARSIPADVLLLRDWQGRFFHKIVAAVDFSPSSAGVLERAIKLAEVHGASLEIIHVLFPPDRDPWGQVMEQRADSGTSYEAMVRNRARDRMDAVLAPFVGRLSAIPSSITILEGESPAAAITAHVDAEEIDLTVTGSHGGSWIEDFVLGSNTERLLRDSSSSILITR